MKFEIDAEGMPDGDYHHFDCASGQGIDIRPQRTEFSVIPFHKKTPVVLMRQGFQVLLKTDF